MSSRHKSSKREPKNHSWSDWEWHQEYKCYVRSRKNRAAPGGLDWEYQNATQESNYNETLTQNTSGELRQTTGPEVPRYTPPAQNRFQLQGLRQTSQSPPESYTHQPDDEAVEQLTRSLQNSDLNDKGKQPAWQQTNSHGHSQQAAQYAQYNQQSSYSSQISYPGSQGYPQQGYNQVGFMPQNIQRTVDQSSPTQYNTGSYQDINSHNNLTPTPYSNASLQQYGYGGTATSSTWDPEYISGGGPDLHPDFKKHYSKEFKLMKVFKMVWHETRGENTTFGTDIITGKFNQPVNASIRRFVIVRAERGHCLCLPIATYKKQGTLKNGLIADHHGVIFTGNKAPELLAGEGPLSKRPVRMIATKAKETLHEASRINYHKIYTVEHNVKCVFIGKIDESHHSRVLEEYLKSFQPK